MGMSIVNVSTTSPRRELEVGPIHEAKTRLEDDPLIWKIFLEGGQRSLEFEPQGTMTS